MPVEGAPDMKGANQARGYSVSLTCGEVAGDDEAKERTSMRFALLRVILADERMVVSTLKVAVYLLMIRYNDHTGQCNPGVGTIAEDTALDPRTVRRALVALRNVLEYLVYESTEGGFKSDTTNTYEFQFPPLTCMTGVTSTPQTTPGSHGKTPDRPVTGTPGSHGTKPLTGVPAKQQLPKQQSEPPYISNVPLPSVAETLPSQRVSGSNGKEKNKRTSEGSKDEPRALLERIDNGIAYVSVRDHECRYRSSSSTTTCWGKSEPSTPTSGSIKSRTTSGAPLGGCNDRLAPCGTETCQQLAREGRARGDSARSGVRPPC
jgi:hypothetical protein